MYLFVQWPEQTETQQPQQGHLFSQSNRILWLTALMFNITAEKIEASTRNFNSSSNLDAHCLCDLKSVDKCKKSESELFKHSFERKSTELWFLLCRDNAASGLDSSECSRRYVSRFYLASDYAWNLKLCYICFRCPVKIVKRWQFCLLFSQPPVDLCPDMVGRVQRGLHRPPPACSAQATSGLPQDQRRRPWHCPHPAHFLLTGSTGWRAAESVPQRLAFHSVTP